MAADRARLSLELLSSALARLGEALDQPIDAPLTLDGTIQRFEFVFELFWKTFKHVLESEGTGTKSPLEAIRAAFAAEIIEAEDVWLGLLKARNETSHTYNLELARQVYERIRAGYQDMQDVLERLSTRTAAIEAAEDQAT
jgi:nucleotidyltransferase substrate binding protein (TIGR01987 family)